MTPFLLTLLLVVALACLASADGVGRWHPTNTNNEERWAVILSDDAVLPYDKLELGGWRIVGHAHKTLNKTHLVLARSRSSKLRAEADPSSWNCTVYAAPLAGQRRAHRSILENIPKEPLWEVQWHLHPYAFPREDTPPQPAHISVLGAWLSGATGQGVQIAVVDDGLQAAHPDIATNFDSRGSWDFNYDKHSVEPSPWDRHGTEAAGTAAAGVNNACGTGVAPNARVAGIRLLAADTVTDEQEALALTYEDQLNHIFSNSWGPVDDGMRLEGPGRFAMAAMKQAIEYGRNGRGAIYVWAAGNGRQVNDNCNFDGYANHRYTITVPAVTSMGEAAYYSEDCSANVVSAPSNGYGTFKIVTTDLIGRGGVGGTYANCSFTFGGTSAAAPIVAGVVALVLSARPELGWRDVQGVLIRSADEIDPLSSSWQRNGAGLRYSHTYGFGRVNATRAVEMARTWPLFGREVELASALSSFVNGSNTSTVEFHNDLIVEAVSVVFSAVVKQRGQMSITLESPFGTQSYLAPFHPDTSRDIRAWSFGSVAHWGESARGTWKLTLAAKSQDGLWKSAAWELHVYGRTRGA